MRNFDETDRNIKESPAASRSTRPLAAWFRRFFSSVRPGHVDHVPSLDMTREALARAERESAMKSRILATVSHDIRTPLSGIAGMSHLLSQTRLTPEQANYLSGIGQSVQALSQLVDDLLDFSAIEAGRFRLHPRDDDLRQMIESVVEMLAHRAHEKGVEIASWVAADVPGLLSFDPERLRQVLFNLVGNAVKFTSEGGVLVSAAMVDGELEIRVRDTGPGMSPRGQEKLFREFEQVGAEKSRIGGTGLGLAISRRIVLEAGGSIDVESQLGTGSTFIVRVPVRQPSDFRLRQARATMLSSTHMLIIAPDGVCREALAATVTSLGGDVVLAAAPADVVASLDAASDAFTDIVVDRRLADLLSEDLRKHPAFRNPATRRILLIEPESRSGSRFFGAGYDSWLVRPLRERSLIGVLQGRMKGIELRDPINDNRSNTRWTQAEGSGLDVLLAEDDPVNRLLLKTVLKKGGHRVSEVETLRDLIAAATQTTGRPGAIVTDLSMPGGSGLDALAAIRDFERSNRLPEVPIIVVTGAAGSETRKAAIDAGATELLVKPADPARLAELLASYATRAA